MTVRNVTAYSDHAGALYACPKGVPKSGGNQALGSFQVPTNSSQMGEYGHLQQVMSGIPQLGEDDSTLDDIRAIYKVFDRDGSGSLDEDEFVAVLSTAGFSFAESLQIFNEVNTDGDDGVSLEEFETWWIATHMHSEQQATPTSSRDPATANQTPATATYDTATRTRHPPPITHHP
eukprot:gene4960-34740_t